MTNRGRSQRRLHCNRAPGRAPILVAIVLVTGAAFAQQSVVEHCRNTSSDADRIACLEAGLLAKEPLVRSDVVATEIVQPQATEEPVGIRADQIIARSQTREDILGELEEAYGLHVVSYDIVPYERLVVTLDNGQVWRQIKGDNQKLRVDLDKNKTVDITEASISGYKLRLNEMRRTIRVERVQ